MEDLSTRKKRVPGYSEFSQIDVDVNDTEKPYTGFGDLLAITKDPNLQAIKQYQTVQDQDNGNTNDLITSDKSGRPFVTVETLGRLAEEQRIDVAMLEHGNDPQVRMDLCGFPRKSEYRLKFMTTEYQRQYPKAFDAINQGHWLFIHGPRGTRKTSFACHMAWKYLEKHPARKAKFISIKSWLAGMMPDSEREEAIPLPYLPPFVILDDLEKYQNTDWQKLQLFDLVDHLYRRSDDFFVVITSNKGLKEIDQQAPGCTRIGPALDRIKEMSLQIPLTGPSSRKSPIIE